MSSSSPCRPRVILRTTEKIVPTGTFTSMFDEPSSGSKSRQYLPHLKCSGIWMIPGSSSDAMVHGLHDDLVRHDVELLLDLALNVLALRGAKDVRETRAADLVGDHLGSE